MDTFIDLLLLLGSLSGLFLVLSLIDALLEGWERRVVAVRRWRLRTDPPTGRGRRRRPVTPAVGVSRPAAGGA